MWNVKNKRISNKGEISNLPVYDFTQFILNKRIFNKHQHISNPPKTRDKAYKYLTTTQKKNYKANATQYAAN